MSIDAVYPYRREAKASKPLVMAVDDDEDNLLLVRYALETFGYVFVGEADGREALAGARQHQPDLILLDILLPYISGMDLIRSFKQDVQVRHIPVIAVTALASDDDRQQLLNAGFTDYISKPYMLEDLESMVQRCVLVTQDSSCELNAAS